MLEIYLIIIIFLIIFLIFLLCKNLFINENVSDNDIVGYPITIERKCLKAFISNHELTILTMKNCLTPSYFNKNFKEINYTSYYDFENRDILYNRTYNLNNNPSVIRIRSYENKDDCYFELKWPGKKVRVLIDKNLNLLDTKYSDKEVKKYLELIKTNKIKEVFKNRYERASYYLTNDPNIRITIDRHLVFFVYEKQYPFENNIIEFKIPKSYTQNQLNSIKKNFSKICNINLNFINYSKFEYGYSFLPL